MNTQRDSVSEPVAEAGPSAILDGLCTKLMLEGPCSLGPEDFARAGTAASLAGFVSMSQAALAMARALPIASDTSYAASIAANLAELRLLIDESAKTGPGLLASCELRLDGAVSPAGAASMSLAGDAELVREFVTESNEHLVSIESQLLLLEKDNTDMETLNGIFRGFHTIKGLSGFFDFTTIQALAHEVETLLDLARTSSICMTPDTIDIVLEATDVLRQELAAITDQLAGKLHPPSEVDAALLRRIRAAATAEVCPHCSEGVHQAPQLQGALSIPSKPDRQIGNRASLRIDTVKLDRLMDMVGEMVISQTQIGQSPALNSLPDPAVQRNLKQLARLTADIQRMTTSMRMVPIGLQFHKSERLVRDLARRAGKDVAFETTGDELELDKTIADELADPLLHMVRNSVDHGIETPAERLASGKSAQARIHISACHQAGHVVVAISDDGRGLDREKIFAKAQQRGLIHKDTQLSDSEVFQFIFAPGFSTASEITDISGRGVGMDVVVKHVQRLRGRIDVQSLPGQGTTFYLKVPLTLAIIEGLIVLVGQRRYIVPIFSVKEMFRPTPAMISTVYQTGELAMVRDVPLPVVRLDRVIGIEHGRTNLWEGTLIVAESDGHRFCLFVDELIGKQEVVIKGLGRQFKCVTGLAGCAILGDGRVGLILDIDGIYRGRS